MSFTTQSEKIIEDGFVFEKLDISGYEDVFKITNKKANLLAIISLHNTTLGSALGGIRIRKYEKFEDALNDVLRLSRGMSYKSAVANVNFGGGKSVIMVNDMKEKTKELLHAFGIAVDRLNGKYICAEDMGSTPEDILTVRDKTKYVVGLPHEKSSGNPSKFTAWGIYRSIQATLDEIYKNSSVEGRKIAIQGVGNVGADLCEILFWHGAELIISDIDQKRLQELSKKYCAKISDDIYSEKCDIFSPCAIGGTVNKKTIEKLNCRAICGSANNQLLEEDDADLLKEKNILYAPDFVVNAGGLLNVAQELNKEGYNSKTARDKIDNLYNVTKEIFELAKKDKISTHKAAVLLAENKIANGIGKKKQKLYFHH